MSIDKESTGLPEVNVQRRTTKVNLSMVAAVLLFFAVAIAIGFWAAKRGSSTTEQPSPPVQTH